MKDLPFSPPAGTPSFDWKSGMWPLVAGAGILGYLAMGLFQKDKKMTKLEKACVVFVIALGEKLEESEKRNAELAENLGDSVSKLRYEDVKHRVAELEQNLAEMTKRAEHAETQLAAAASENRDGRRKRSPAQRS